MNHPIDLLRTCHVLVEGAVARSLAPLDLRTDQYNTLRALESGPLRMSDLAARLLCDDSTTTRIVSSLERRHLLTRRSDARDGRARLARLTEQGRTVLLAAERAAEETVARLGMPERSRSELQRVLETLERALTAETQEMSDDE
ncbi:MAG: MarR family winged helix-turn-helix transcriptional regulator [Spirochaetota bacterium]